VTESTSIRFANVLLSAVNLAEGQCLAVRSEPVHWEFLTILAREAYRRGAKYVHVDSAHPGLYKERVDHSREEYLSFVPGYRAKIHEHYVDEHWARISIAGQEDPDLLALLDPRRNGIAQKALAKVDIPMRRAIQSDKIRWVVTAMPTPKWAAKVLGCEPGPEAADELWKVMEPILRMDQPDPVAAWVAHGEALAARQRALAELDLDAVRFVGPGTNLTIGLPENSVWLGGGAKTPDGLWFLPNLPTEEVFTTPDYRRASGEVTLTRPALILGRTVLGARFRFEEGRAVEWSATEGEETLTELFAIDDEACRLGELALVDAESPIYKSGLVFHNILFDENAACHIAFGSSYPGGISGGDDMDPDVYRAAGGNVSAVHSDVMIGSPDVDVIGIGRDGQSIPLMAKGLWSV
jgi:aminopeptidase